MLGQRSRSYYRWRSSWHSGRGVLRLATSIALVAGGERLCRATKTLSPRLPLSSLNAHSHQSVFRHGNDGYSSDAPAARKTPNQLKLQKILEPEAVRLERTLVSRALVGSSAVAPVPAQSRVSSQQEHGAVEHVWWRSHTDLCIELLNLRILLGNNELCLPQFRLCLVVRFILLKALDQVSCLDA